jgi:hypothetical protein
MVASKLRPTLVISLLNNQHAPTTIEMPRIPTSLLRQAHTIDPFLPSLLVPCRDLHAAQNELRWLREYVERVAKARQARGDILSKGALLRQMIKQRVMGRPLQYIMGNEYFGDLEIRCSPGVLIPRWVSILPLERHVLTTRIGKTQQHQSQISYGCCKMHRNFLPKYVSWTSALAPVAYPSSSDTSCPWRVPMSAYAYWALMSRTKR